jgi:hypothetical protein
VNGAVIDDTDTSPIPAAICSLVDFQGNSIADSKDTFIQAVSDDEGNFTLRGIPLDIEATIECYPDDLPNLVLSAYISSVGAEVGETLPDEVVGPKSTVVTNILRQFRVSDPTFQQYADLTAVELARQAAIESQADEDAGIRLIADTAVQLFYPMYKLQVDTIDFSNQGNSSNYGALEDISLDGGLDDQVWEENQLIQVGVESKASSLEAEAGLDFETASSTGSIQGRVTDGEGNPIIDRDVIVNNGAQGDETDVNGEFLIQEVPAGETAIVVQGFGYVATVQVIALAVVPADIVIRTGTIEGLVTGQAAFPEPQAGYTVIAMQNGVQVGNGAVSDSEGKFVLENIPVGETLVTFQSPPVTGYTDDTVTVIENQTVSVHLTVTVLL